MIIGAHSILHSKMPQLDRSFLRDVLGFPSVDVGDGWLIFEALITDLTRRRINCSPVRDQGWGLLTQVTLPGGGKLGIYQPRHARPKPMGAQKSAARRKTTTAPPPKKKKKKAARRR